MNYSTDIEGNQRRAGKEHRAYHRHAQNAARILARAFGLGLLVHAFQSLRHMTGRGLHEPLKIAIRQSRRVALARSLIHLFPVGFSLFEVILNWNQYYVGVHTYNQASYQFLAKVHEIMIQASLGTIVFSFVRHEMAVGQGLPFGAMFSGLQLNQISYLWSMEFWGSLRSQHHDVWRKARLAVIVTMCVTLGSVCGPSSAVLLIPRLAFWPAGSTHIWINTTREQLWPSVVDSSIVPNNCSLALEEAISNGCPWSEWTSIRTYLTASRGSVPEPYRHLYGFSYSPGFVEQSGKSALREMYIKEDAGYASQNVWPGSSTTQQVAVSDAHLSAASLWWMALTNVTARHGHGNSLSDQSDASHFIQNGYFQPYVDSFCAPDIIEGKNDDRPLVFPNLLTANDDSQSDTTIQYYGERGLESVPAITKPGLNRSEILGTFEPSSQYRLTWIELVETQFNGSAIGAVIILPKATKNNTQDILVCNLAAGWGESVLTLQTSESSLAGRVRSSAKLPGLQYGIVPIQVSNVPAEEANSDIIFQYPWFPQVPINITTSWADTLSPRIAGTNDTVINRLMNDPMWPGDPKSYAHFILSALVANGLARTSFVSELQGNLKTFVGPTNDTELDGNYWLSGQGDVFTVNASQAENWTKLYMESTLEGHAYNVSGTPPKVAIAILLVYCLLALCHVCYAGIFGLSSTSWDCIAEVTALAMNSTPTACLRNTCAGISELHIFKLPVRILAIKDDEGEGEHLELVFGDVSEEKTKQSLIKPNRAYGTMPMGKDKQS